MSAKRIIRNLSLLVIGFIVLLVILAELFKDQVVKTVLERSAKSFEVPLRVRDVDLTLLRKFPLATIEFNDVLLVDSLNGHFQDTILSIQKLYASIDIQQLIDGIVYVKKIEVNGASANYLIDSTGVSNLDFIFEAMSYDSVQAEEPDTSKLQGIYELEDLILEDIKLNYSDAPLQLTTTIQLPNVSVKGEVKPNGFMASIEGSAMLSNVSFENYRLADLSSSVLEFNLEAINDTISVNKLDVNAPHTVVTCAGKVINGDWPYLDLSYNGEISSLKHLMELLPQKYIKEYKVHQLDGGVSINGTVSGLLSDSLMPRIDAKYQIDNLQVKYDTYPFINHLALTGTYSNGEKASSSTTHIYIGSLEAETMNSKFSASGDIKNLDEIFYNFKLGANVELSDWINFVPENTINQMDGNLYASILTSGILPDSITDSFTEYALERTICSINAENVNLEMDSVPVIKGFSGKLKFEDRSLDFTDVSVKVPEYNFDLTDGLLSSRYSGSIDDIDNMAFTVDTFRLELFNNNELSGSGYLESLNSGVYWLKAYSTLNLNQLNPMVPDSLVSDMSGSMQASFISAGTLNIDSIADQSIDLLLGQSEFKFETKDLTVITPDTLASINNLTTSVSYRDDSLSINKTSGIYNSIEFSADSASITNLYAGFFNNQKETILVKGNYAVGDIDYAFFTPFMDEDSTSIDASESIEKAEPELWSYKFQGNVAARSFKYGKALFQNMSSKVLAKPDYYVADQFKVDAFRGDMLASFKYEAFSNDRSIASFKTDVKGMDINQLFKDFDDFEEYLEEGQAPYITSEQVFGILSSHMDGKIVMHDYEPVYDSLLLKGNLHLDEGALIGVKEIAEIEQIPGIGIKGLDELRFSELESSVFMFKNDIYIPKTEIRSSAFDAMFLGMYSFNEDFAYHIRIFLGEVLAGKSKKTLAKQSKDGGFDKEDKNKITKGRTSLYVVSKQEDGKFKAGLDNKKERRNMEAKVNLQEQMVNMKFHPKLVNYNVED